jgi:ribosomal-protein-alanine N-acetyltransferase
MRPQPTLETVRLLLRPFSQEDGTRVMHLAGEREIAMNTGTIPHPYEEGMAEEWISTHQELFIKREAAIFAICLRETEELIGAIGIEVNRDHDCGELGYWIGKPFWNQGYCTEAARVAVEYAFDALELNRIGAIHFTRNPASGQVMQKIGMRYEGERRQAMKRWGEYVDIACYGLLREEITPSGS